jgi:hypothetical protein
MGDEIIQFVGLKFLKGRFGTDSDAMEDMDTEKTLSIGDLLKLSYPDSDTGDVWKAIITPGRIVLEMAQ